MEATPVGVVIVDPQTGVTKEYSIENTPTWVDRIQPEKFIETQLNDWGQYVNGLLEFLESKTNCRLPKVCRWFMVKITGRIGTPD